MFRGRGGRGELSRPDPRTVESAVEGSTSCERESVPPSLPRRSPNRFVFPAPFFPPFLRPPSAREEEKTFRLDSRPSVDRRVGESIRGVGQRSSSIKERSRSKRSRTVSGHTRGLSSFCWSRGDTESKMSTHISSGKILRSPVWMLSLIRSLFLYVEGGGVCTVQD